MQYGVCPLSSEAIFTTIAYWHVKVEKKALRSACPLGSEAISITIAYWHVGIPVCLGISTGASEGGQAPLSCGSEGGQAPLSCGKRKNL